jgi:hypothetical protein
MATDIVEMIHRNIAGMIDDEGVFPHQMIVLKKDGSVTMLSLSVNPPSMFKEMARWKAMPDTAELVFGLDRFCLPDQGTTLGDCVACLHWDGILWRTFIVEYQNEPRIVKPVDRDNAWWNATMRRESPGLFPFEVK